MTIEVIQGGERVEGDNNAPVTDARLDETEHDGEAFLS